MGIKSAFKGCLRFCGRPAISLRTSSMAVGWNLEWWFTDGREMETRGEGARELDKRGGDGGSGNGGVRIHGYSRLSHCNKLCLRVARITDSTTLIIIGFGVAR